MLSRLKLGAFALIPPLTLLMRRTYNQTSNTMASSNISLIIPLVDADQSRRAGGKAINLSKLIAARFAVPRGFVISADAHRFHLWASGVRNIAASKETPESRESAHAAIISSEISDDVWHSIADAYHRLSLQLGFTDPKVIVRSSPVEENSAHPSMSIPNVSGEEALKAAIKEIWASAWNEGIDIAAEPAMAVVVQQMIEGHARGTARTADPTTGDPRSVVIACEHTNGSASFKVDLGDVCIVEREGEELSGIDDAGILRLAEKAVLAESVISSPINIEWIHEGGRFWVLQAEAITGDPAFFASDTDNNPAASSDYLRVSSKPVSFLAQRLFHAQQETEGIRLHNGYVYRAKGSDSIEPPKGWQPSAERLLEKWRSEIAPELAAKTQALLAIDFKSCEYDKLLELLAEAGEVSSRAFAWVQETQYPCAAFPVMLKEKLNSDAIYEKIIGGLSSTSFMRDARLQELGDRFGIAQEADKLSDEHWWLSFRKDVKAFACEYGYAFTGSSEMYDPALWKSWVEDIDLVFRMIGAIARRGTRASLVTLHCAAEELALQAEKEAAARLNPTERSRFTRLVRSTRGWLCANDECEQLYTLACTTLRMVVIELSRRLCKSGIITRQEDIFCLSIGELRSISLEPSADERASIINKIAARKHEAWLQERLVAHRFASTGKTSEELFKGTAISSSSATGRARIVRNIEDAGELEAGDIMVVKSLAPAWTPFLATAGGIVSEDSSILCASDRSLIGDYGIAAIVGCEGIMSSPIDGRRITVNGTDGIVRYALTS